MTSMIFRRHLSRRTVLRGAGATLALPFLDAMHPALTPPPEGVVRSVFVFAPNGKKMDDWRPEATGPTYDLPYLLEPLSPYKESLTVLSGLALDGAFAHGDGPGDHARAAGAFLTCAHPRKTGGADIQAGVSVDQVIAQQLGSETRFASLELGLERGRLSGKCDSGYSCAYSNNVSWRSPSSPNAKETEPREVFRRLFGDPSKVRSQAAKQQEARRRSLVLDAVLDDAKSLRGRLGAKDVEKLDEYIEAVHALDKRLQRPKTPNKRRLAPEGLVQRVEDSDWVERLRVHYEMIGIALAADLTRTVTFMLGNAGSNRSYRFLDIPDGHHTLSHHKKDPTKLAKIRKINRFHVEEFSRFIGQLHKLSEGGKTLLERSQILYGSGIGDGNRHNHDELPFILLGSANGRVKPGQHRAFPRRTPAANLYLSMIRNTGAKASTFGDSTKALF